MIFLLVFQIANFPHHGYEIKDKDRNHKEIVINKLKKLLKYKYGSI